MVTRSLQPVVLVCLGLCVAVPQGAVAATPYLVKNINPASSPASSNPQGFATLGNGVDLFVADDGRDGQELWRTDGTAAGTSKVLDACPGACWGFPQVVAVTPRGAFFTASSDLWLTHGMPGDAVHLSGVRGVSTSLWVASRGLLFFYSGDFPTYGPLWRSDGTAVGTYSLNVHAAVKNEFVEMGGRVYFGGDDGPSGPSLWRSDGTLAGTEPVWTPGPASFGLPGASLLRVVGGRLVFVAPGSDGAPALWSTDGDHAPDLITGPPRVVDAAVFAGRVLLYGLTSEPDVQAQLWITDGTTAGTSLLATVQGLAISPTEVSDPSTVLPPGRFLFHADDGVHGFEPWVTDGTPAGTHLLLDICPGSCNSLAFFYHVQSAAGGAYFGAQDPSRGFELWITDGTAAGTRLVKDLCPGLCSGSPFNFRTVNGKLVFTAHAPDRRSVLWRTDGTPQGTVRITDLGAGSSIDPIAVLSPGTLIFSGSDAVHGTELWRTNGTAAGTALVKDIASDNLLGSQPASFMTAGGKAFFLASDAAHGRELWTSDATSQGTHLVKDLTPGPGPQSWPADPVSAEAGGKLFFLGFAKNAWGLWKSDGTTAGTILLTPPSQTIFGSLAAVGNTVFFAAPRDFGQELWKSDGTVAGTVPVPGTPLSELGELAPLHGRLLFFSNDFGEPELWSSDGTAAGTFLVKNISGGVYVPSNPSHLTEHNGRFFFFADDSVHGPGLWRTDGTEAGTVLAADLAVGPSFTPHLLASTGTKLFILGANNDGEGLWTSDGTAAGTRRIFTWLGSGDPQPKSAIFQGRLYFVSQGTLWRSDGTAAGTGPFLDSAGQPFLNAGSLRALSHHLYFTAGRDPNLWQTDGTRAGTRPVATPTTGSMQVLGDLFQVGTRLFFQGQDAAAGRELWAIGPD